MDYDNQVDNFGLVDVSYNLVDGLDAVAEAQFIPGAGVTPRLGLQYFKETGNVSIYALATTSVKGDAEILTSMSYANKLSKNLKLIISGENVTNLGEAGHNFSTQLLRAGVGIGKYETGLGLNLMEAEGNVNANAGGYLKVNF